MVWTEAVKGLIPGSNGKRTWLECVKLGRVGLFSSPGALGQGLGVGWRPGLLTIDG